MAGLLTVLVVATLVQKWVKDNAVEPAAIELDVSEPQGSFFARWGMHCGSFSGAPFLYISAVLVLGAARVWLFRMPTAPSTIP